MIAGRGHITRRHFLGTAAGTALGSLAVPHVLRGAPGVPHTHASRAALITGESRADNVFQALRLVEKQIQQSLAHKRRIVIKPNLVSANNQLATTHVDCMEAILDFLTPLHKKEILVAESPAAFALAVGDLLSDRARAERIGLAGQRYVRRRFRPADGLARLEQCLTKNMPGVRAL